MNENRNLLIAFGLSIAILLGFHQFYEKPRQEKLMQQKLQEQALQAQTPATITNPEPQKIAPDSAPEQKAVEKSARINIENESVSGSIRQVGAVIDDILLTNYTENTDPNSPKIRLLDESFENSYSVSSGWKTADSSNVGALPNETTNWQIQGENHKLTPEHPIVLTWFNDRGLKFERIISIDNKYLITVTDQVTNHGENSVTLQVQGQIRRKNPPKSQGFYILHEGPIGYFNNKLFEESYEDLAKTPFTQQATNGWFGFTDKFWLVSLIPDSKSAVNIEYSAQGTTNIAQFTATPITVKPEETSTYSYKVFAGAKVLSLLDDYEPMVGVPHFDLAVDFGWFYFLTKPLFYVLEYFHELLGNLGLAILLLTILFKVMLYPMATKSYRSMARLKNLQPKIQHVQSIYKEDRTRQSQELMALYKKEKVNPAGGCLPMLIQAPIFFCLYKVLFVSIEMRHAPFFGWIHDLAAPDPTSFVNLFGLLPFTSPSFLQIGIWPILMGITMVIQQRMNPQPTDPAQAKVMMIMPIMFTYLFASFPAGLVVYWTWNNLLSMAQQWLITKQMNKK
ncbi:MAG: membrane protein insertase YidC [Proteobacteria bacterium]|nr:membrane protein insertase YidC [Pseudomonadota bacterium]